MQDPKKYYDAETLLDEVLQSEPGFSLPDNFANEIVKKVERKFAWEQYIREFLIYFCVFIGMAGVLVAMKFIWFDADWKEWLGFVANNAGIVAGLVIIPTFILFVDRVVLRYFMFKTTRDLT